MPTLIHFRNFLGSGALCGAAAPGEGVTLQPGEVTCGKCLALIGRVEPPHRSGSGPHRRA